MPAILAYGNTTSSRQLHIADERGGMGGAAESSTVLFPWVSSCVAWSPVTTLQKHCCAFYRTVLCWYQYCTTTVLLLMRLFYNSSASPIPPGIVSYTCYLLQIAQLLSGLMSCFPAVWCGAILSAIVPTPFWKAVTAHTVLRRKDVIRRWCMVMVTILTHASIRVTLFG